MIILCWSHFGRLASYGGYSKPHLLQSWSHIRMLQSKVDQALHGGVLGNVCIRLLATFLMQLLVRRLKPNPMLEWMANNILCGY